MRRFVVAAVGAVLLVGPAGVVTAEASAAIGQPAVTATWPVVKAGQSGERVRVVQLLLNQRGYRVSVDGKFGKSTTTAVQSFQRANRLTADGHVGANTWQKLVVTIRRGSKGDAVKALQHQLRFQYGYKSVAVDGAFGAATQTAVKSFQTKRGLHADGIVGAGTWRALEA
jgi:peptidoglycan hydrolase-like protein with peptidoglycan-binding domain